MERVLPRPGSRGWLWGHGPVSLFKTLLPLYNIVLMSQRVSKQERDGAWRATELSCAAEGCARPLQGQTGKDSVGQARYQKGLRPAHGACSMLHPSWRSSNNPDPSST